jgi:serine O-acetyltransferase
VRIEHFGGMILVARAIGDDVIIRQNTTFGIRTPAEPGANPTIGDRVDIRAGAVILGDVVIGDGARIGANAVVLDDVPAGALAVGAPARVVVPRRPD